MDKHEKRKILVIDDEQYRHDWFDKQFASDYIVCHVYNAEQALDALSHTSFAVAFFDHDLGHGPADGTYIANKLMNEPEKYLMPNHVVVHSLNPVGAQNIVSKFVNMGISVKKCSFDILLEYENVQEVLVSRSARI